MKHAKTSRISSLLALVLAVVMLLALVGCGESKPADENKPAATTTAAATTTVADDAGDDTTTTAGDVTDETTTAGEDATTTAGEEAPTTNNFFGGGATTSKTTAGNNNSSNGSSSSARGDYKAKTKQLLSSVPASLKGTKLTMQIWWTASKDDTNEAKIFADQTGIQVRYVTSSLSKYQTDLSAKVTGGNPPSLAAIINEWYPQPITRGLMQPIENTGWDYSNKSKNAWEKDIFAHAMMDQFSYKGKWYGIALKGSNMSTFEVMFFNKKMMANNVKAGTDPYSLWKKGQWNWETCLNLAKQYSQPDKNKYGLTLIYQNFWMLSAGQDFVLSDAKGLKNNINSSKLLDAWYHAWDMINTHKVIPTVFKDQQKLFFNSQLPMLGSGSYYMQCDPSFDYVPQNMKDDWSVVPFPSPKGQASVAACEGTVWGFPTKVKGNQLQAGMWYLRYFLDDYKCSDPSFYPKDECWEIMSWMWNQKIQSYNSVGVLAYGGKFTSTSIQYKVIDEAATKAQVKSNLVAWEAELDSQITKIMNELA